jgi:hypothetical protein
MKMKKIRYWFRVLHRDIGYFFIGSSLIYGLSGVALNHLKDWNPNYSVAFSSFNSDLQIDKKDTSAASVEELLTDLDLEDEYKKHYFPKDSVLKVFLKGGSTVMLDLKSGYGEVELLKKRPIFYEVNFLHYNPNAWWMWFSDLFAVALIFLAISSFFIVKGRHGAVGKGGIYIALGIIIPLIMLFLSL